MGPPGDPILVNPYLKTDARGAGPLHSDCLIGVWPCYQQEDKFPYYVVGVGSKCSKKCPLQLLGKALLSQVEGMKSTLIMYQQFFVVLIVLPSLLVGICNGFVATQDGPVHVFDNVFSADACHLIHKLAIEHSDRASNCDGSSIFYRDDDNEILTPLEIAIDSALTAMGDNSPVVEYWSREEYINIDAHADIDEGELLDDGGNIRCPTNGHILYLSVGERIRGPTFIFPNKLVGWGCNDSEQGVELVTVPAVEGRVVRFDGRAMHAVPKPADRWLLSDNEERLLREKENEDYGESADFWVDEEDEEEECDEGTIDQRSVLLFNTWEWGPAFVDQDPAINMPAGIELSNNDNDGREIMSNWKEHYGPDFSKVKCNDSQKWENALLITKAPSEPGTDSSDDILRASLMGNSSRRCYPKTNAKLRLSHEIKDRMRSAVVAPREPSRFVLLKEEL